MNGNDSGVHRSTRQCINIFETYSALVSSVGLGFVIGQGRDVCLIFVNFGTAS